VKWQEERRDLTDRDQDPDHKSLQGSDIEAANKESQSLVTHELKITMNPTQTVRRALKLFSQLHKCNLRCQIRLWSPRQWAFTELLSMLDESMLAELKGT